MRAIVITMDSDLPAHNPHQLLTNRQPEAITSKAAASGSIGLKKGLENTVMHGRVNTDTGIDDLTSESGPARCTRDSNMDAARSRELNRIGDQVG